MQSLTAAQVTAAPSPPFLNSLKYSGFFPGSHLLLSLMLANEPRVFSWELTLSQTDQYLIDQFRATGQINFLEDVLQRHLQPIRSAVFQMVLNHDVADDVTQEIFLRVVRGIDQFEGGSLFSTWLFRITMNTVHSFLKRRSQSNVHFYDELPEGAAVSHNSPDGPVLQAEFTTQIQTALETLSPSLRAAVVLVCLQGRSTVEAAEIEDCSTDTMYWRVHEARRQLKQLLAGHLS